MNTIPYTIADTDTTTKVNPLDVYGSGGKGGGGGSGPKEAKNTLKSNAVATVLIAVSEGEIGGWVSDDARKDIFFDQTPLMNSNGTLNFEGVEYDYRVGLPSQSPVSGISNVENTLQIGTQVKKDRGPVVRAVSSKEIDSVRVVVDIPSLVKITKKNGNQNETSVQIKFAVFDEIAQVWEDRGTHTISGKCTAPYQQAFRLTRPTGTARWLVKFERLTDDSDSNYLSNDTVWSYMTEIENDRHTYNNTAYVKVRVSIDKFGNSIPKLSFRMKGIKCRVPTVYDQSQIGVPNGIVYTGTWNGSWKLEATDNPVWIIYELLTNERYGMAIDESYINVFEWLPLAKYADGCSADGRFVGVDDGLGGKRARFTIRTQITSQQEAMAVINAIASSMRSITYWGAGSVQLSLDMPKLPRYSFGESNVIDGNFVYGGTQLGDMYTRANVTFNNPDDFYQQDIAVHVDATAERALGQRIQTDVTKYGCTNEAEATMFGRWLVDTAQTQTETVTFNITGAHWSIRPGDVFEVNDKHWTGRDNSGRLFNEEPEFLQDPDGLVVGRYADTEFDAGYQETTEYGWEGRPLDYFKVRLDKEVTLTAGDDYTLTLGACHEAVIQIAKTQFVTFTVNSRTVRGTPTDIIYLDVDDRFPPHSTLYWDNNMGGGSLVAGYVELFGKPLNFWSLKSNKLAPRQFTCMNIKEVRSNEFEVTGVFYDPTKFSRVEENVILPKIPSRIPTSGGLTPSPRTLSFRVVGQTVGGATQNNLVVNWPFVSGALGYQVSYQFNGGSVIGPVTVDVPEFVINDADNGEYFVSVRAVNVVGALSTPTTGSYTLDINNQAVSGGSTGGSGVGETGQPASDPLTSTSGFAAPTNLRLKTIGGTTFTTQDAFITWDAPAAVSGLAVAYYEFTVVDFTTNTVRRREVADLNEFNYTFGLNQSDGLARKFKVQVRAVDNLGNFTQAAVATFENPAPAVPAFVSLTNVNNTLRLEHAASTASDAQGTVICADIVSGFTPSLENKVDENSGTIHEVPAEPDTTFYVRYAIYDSFTNQPELLIWSDEYMIETGASTVQLDPIFGLIDAPQLGRVYPLILNSPVTFLHNKFMGKSITGTANVRFLVDGTPMGILNISNVMSSVDMEALVEIGSKTEILIYDMSTDFVGFSFQLDSREGSV